MHTNRIIFCNVAAVSFLLVTASAFVVSPVQVSTVSPTRRITSSRHQLTTRIRKRIIPEPASPLNPKYYLNHRWNERTKMARSNNGNDNDNGNDPSKSNQDRLRGFIFAIMVALGANAPFIYVMANPPSAEEREVMLMDFCKGDVCTLLGGGSGYGGGDRGEDFIGAEVAEGMPTVEDFEAMARAAAELAMGTMSVVTTGDLNLH